MRDGRKSREVEGGRREDWRGEMGGERGLFDLFNRGRKKKLLLIIYILACSFREAALMAGIRSIRKVPS